MKDKYTVEHKLQHANLYKRVGNENYIEKELKRMTAC